MSSACKLSQLSATEQIVTCFNECFKIAENTIIVGGGIEPLYTPTGDSGLGYHQITFKDDYASSALHEIAHWCIAGPARRRLEDYGYWYEPDGRSLAQQARFEKVEVKPQALEWLFSELANIRFRVSADNLSNSVGASETFKRAIQEQAQNYIEHLPECANVFAKALSIQFNVSWPLSPSVFDWRKV